MNKISETNLPGVLVIDPQVFNDQRGFFFESLNLKEFNEKTGLNESFVQDNHSKSISGTLRGMHYQLKFPQGKLMRVSKGSILDVVVDLRKSSPTFKHSFTIELSDENYKQLWVPKGMAHGFLVLSKEAEFLYKTTDYYYPEDEHCLLWNDPTINIKWPKIDNIQLSAKDKLGKTLDKLILPQ